MKLKEKAPFLAFIFSLVFFAFLWGIVTARYQLFPYYVFRDAKIVFDELRGNRTLGKRPESIHTFEARDNYTGGGVTRYSPDASFNGYTLFSVFTDNGFVNRLIDIEGNVLHEWFVKFSDVWGKKAPFLKEQFGDEWTAWHGIQLMPNGDLIASFMDNGRPYCGGLVKLNMESEVIWSVPEGTHHDVHIGEDGLIYVPSMVLVDKKSDSASKPTRSLYPHKDPKAAPRESYWGLPLLKEEILILNQQGETQEKISLLDAFFHSDYRARHTSFFHVEKHPSGDHDPTHTNDIELITEEWAEHHPNVEAGDIMISVRNMSSVAIIDRSQKKIKWMTSGPFSKQHDPDLLDNGNILIFDNWGLTGSDSGASRIIEWDPKSQEIVWEFRGTPEDPFHSTFRGSQQQLPNGNILITETTGGRILEVTRSGEIAWEYINELKNGKVGAVIRAQRYSPEDLPFVKLVSGN